MKLPTNRRGQRENVKVLIIKRLVFLAWTMTVFWPFFSTFAYMIKEEKVDKKRIAYARDVYRQRMQEGFRMAPPFKGFGIALMWFAMDEPELFKLVMKQDKPMASREEYIDTHVGFKEESIAAIVNTFGLASNEAEALYYHLVTVALGLAFVINEGNCTMSIGQVAEVMGKSVRAYLMEIHAGADAREGFVPGEGSGPRGDVGSYVDKGLENIQKQTHMLLLNTLISQNILLKELHKSPRYVRDTEWAELERVHRNTFAATPQSLRRNYPFLTPGDIRLIILSRFQFSVADSAALLGISSTSVTKARQRLKAKLDTDNLETGLEKLK